MILGIVITSAPPFIVEKVKRRSWVLAHPDEVLVDTDDAGNEGRTPTVRSPDARQPR